MASARSFLSEEQFLCSICLDVFTDPITTPCGHNYCKTSITHHWDSNDVCKCPLCQKTFYTRPEFSVNKVLSEMADQFKKMRQKNKQEPAKADEENISRTLIITLILNLLLTLTLCQLFTKSDQIVSLKEDYEGKKAELGKTDAEVQQMIQERQLKIQEFNYSVALSKTFAERKIADSVQVFTAMMSLMQRSQNEFVGVIEENHKTTEKQAEGFIKELQQEITELTKRSSELKQLLHTEDPLHLLNNFLSINIPPPTKDWTQVHVHQPSYEETVRTVVEKTLRKEMEKKRCDAELRMVQQYEVDVTLDPDTQRYFVLSQDGKQVNRGHEKKDLPDNPDIFSYLHIVLGKQSFSSGRFYYEVQVKVKTDWDLGVRFRELINSVGPITLSPNNSYWAIGMRNGSKYYAVADPDVLLPVREELQIVGVFVDYEEGVVSFYDVVAKLHLYSFTDCTFTEELYPYFTQYLHHDGKYDALILVLIVSFFFISLKLLIDKMSFNS